MIWFSASSNMNSLGQAPSLPQLAGKVPALKQVGHHVHLPLLGCQQGATRDAAAWCLPIMAAESRALHIWEEGKANDGMHGLAMVAQTTHEECCWRHQAMRINPHRQCAHVC